MGHENGEVNLLYFLFLKALLRLLRGLAFRLLPLRIEQCVHVKHDVI